MKPKQYMNMRHIVRKTHIFHKSEGADSKNIRQVSGQTSTENTGASGAVPIRDVIGFCRWRRTFQSGCWS